MFIEAGRSKERNDPGQVRLRWLEEASREKEAADHELKATARPHKRDGK